MTEHADPAVEKNRDRRNVRQRRRAHDGGTEAQGRGQVKQIVNGTKGMNALVAGEDVARPFDDRIDRSDELQAGMVDQRICVRPTGRSNAQDGDRNGCAGRVVMSHVPFFDTWSSTLKEDSAVGLTRWCRWLIP